TAGERSLREKAHAHDPCLEACKGSFAIHPGLVDGLHRQADTLVVPKGQLDRRFQDAVRIDSLDCLCHRTLRSRRLRPAARHCKPGRYAARFRRIRPITSSIEKNPGPKASTISDVSR